MILTKQDEMINLWEIIIKNDTVPLYEIVCVSHEAEFPASIRWIVCKLPASFLLIHSARGKLKQNNYRLSFRLKGVLERTNKNPVSHMCYVKTISTQLCTDDLFNPKSSQPLLVNLKIQSTF